MNKGHVYAVWSLFHERGKKLEVIRQMVGDILTFDEKTITKSQGKSEIPLATSNPYDPNTSPPDILQYLPPDGSYFSLFSDPYAKMTYYMPKTGNNTARFWQGTRMENHSFTDSELKLLDFLSQHRCATRSQIARAVFTDRDNVYKIKDFITKCHQRGIISAFSWKTPCTDGKKKPLIYGLTRVGAEVAEQLFHIRVPDRFKFHAVTFPNGAGPLMSHFYSHLTANELFCQLKSIDRIVKWEREPHILLEDQTTFRPAFVAEVIKDAGDLKTLWIEPVRITNGWYQRLISRFREIQIGFDKVSSSLKPDRLILIVDSDSRIPMIGALAEEHMPDVVLRFTTDERLLAGIDKQTFLSLNPVDGTLILSPIPFLLKDANGMKASEYLAHQVVEITEDDFEDI
ncbi:replication-relaxation family protein (plasmid) [Sporosarcina psychrophila]|uniref:replication-relaxation family protein n=1 Tax=Sporosarcina psychrophila TaxID=1476 RepID=UPI0030D38085